MYNQYNDFEDFVQKEAAKQKEYDRLNEEVVNAAEQKILQQRISNGEKHYEFMTADKESKILLEINKDNDNGIKDDQKHKNFLHDIEEAASLIYTDIIHMSRPYLMRTYNERICIRASRRRPIYASSMEEARQYYHDFYEKNDPLL